MEVIQPLIKPSDDFDTDEEKTTYEDNNLPTKKQVSIWYMLGLLAYQYCLGVVQGSLIVLILPYEVQRYFPDKPAETLGNLHRNFIQGHFEVFSEYNFIDRDCRSNKFCYLFIWTLVRYY